MLTVIVPTKNRATYLLRAVQGVLSQTYKEFEIIIINDCSTDETSELISTLQEQHPQIKVINNQVSLGAAEARCIALEQCKSEFVLFHDDDDYLTDPCFLEEAVKNFTTGISCVSANSIVEQIDGTSGKHLVGAVGRISGEQFLLGFTTRYNKPSSTFTTVFRRSSLLESGIVQSRVINDSALYVRALSVGDIYVLERIVGCHLRHRDSLSYNMSVELGRKSINEPLTVCHSLNWPKATKKRWSERNFLGIYLYMLESKISFLDCCKLITALLRYYPFPSLQTTVAVIKATTKHQLRKLLRK